VGWGIDGPYLRRFAEQCVKGIESDTPQPDIGLFGAEFPDMSGVLAYLHFHPDNAKLMERVVILARKSAKASLHTPGAWDHPSTRPAVGRHERPIIAITTASDILINAKVLHDGMSVEEAREILGQPSSEGPDARMWSLPLSEPGAHRFFVANLSATLTDGRLNHFCYAIGG
jgi:hypothetical protein